MIDGWSLFWTIGMGRIATGQALLLLSLAACTIAVSVAVFRGYRCGQWDLLRDILLILVLMVFVCLGLLIPTHDLGRSSRFLFINYGLMWSCLILAVVKLNWRLNVVIGGLLIGPSLGWLWVQSDRVDKFKIMYNQLTDDDIIIQDYFTVYLDEDYRYLVYVRDGCSTEDTTSEFWIWNGGSVGINDAESKPPLDDLRTFYFEDYGVNFEGRCVAQVPTLEHEINYIRTGQDLKIWRDDFPYPFIGKSYNVWMSSYVAGDEPLFRDIFDCVSQ